MKKTKKKLFDKVVLGNSSFASEDDLKSKEGIAEPLSSDFRTPSYQKRGRKDIFTPEVLGSLDSGKISDRHAVLGLASVISATGQNLSEFTITVILFNDIARSIVKNRHLEYLQGCALC